MNQILHPEPARRQTQPDTCGCGRRFVGVRWTHWLVALLATSSILGSEPDSMTLEGDLSAIYTNGEFVVWNPKSGRGGGMTAATSANPAGESAPTSLESSLDVVGKAAIGTNGRFAIEVPVRTPRLVNFYVLNATDADGERVAPIKGNQFILEPGRLRLTMLRRDRFVIEGGRYNDAVYNVWRESEPYRAAQAEHELLSRPVDGESEEARRRRVDRASSAQARILELENEGRSRPLVPIPTPSRVDSPSRPPGSLGHGSSTRCVPWPN